ncbi:MAG: hypothetical protein HWD58_17115 [Bacteroidota bacterium]|nr:MAG: hypothetical protein HWD58_17115 [Bacteroidota bacterium]
MQWYYGNLHSHTALSDGTGPATAAFNFSVAALCMDFLGVSDHNHATAGMSLANWAQGNKKLIRFRIKIFWHYTAWNGERFQLEVMWWFMEKILWWDGRQGTTKSL